MRNKLKGCCDHVPSLFIFNELRVNNSLSRESYTVFKLSYTWVPWIVVFKFMMHTTEFYIALGSAIVLGAIVLDLRFEKTSSQEDKV